MAITEATTPRRRGLVRNVFHLGLGQVTTTVLSILLSASVARSLGAADFGLLYLMMTVATFAYVIVDWGHGPYIIREVARHPRRSGELLGSAFVVRGVMALVMCVLAVAATWLLGYDARTRVLTAVLIVAWVPQYSGMSFTWVFRGVERMDFDALLNVVLKFTTLGVSLVCLALGGRLLGLTIGWSVAGTITLILAIVLYRRLQLPAIQGTTIAARELVRDGAPMLAMSLAVAVQPYFDANILYKLTPRDVVGWYGAAWNIAGTLVAPAVILGATLYPRLSRAATDEAEFKRALRTSFRPLFLVAVLGAVGTYLFADVAIGLIYTQRKFGPASAILRAFAPALLLLYVDMLMGYAILAVGKAWGLAGAKAAAVFVTTGLELVLVPFFQTRYGNGGIGTVVSLAAGELLMVAAATLLIRQAIDARMVGDLCRGLVVGGATLLLMRSLPPLTPFVAIPICVLAFFGLSLAFGLVKRSDVELLVAGFSKRNAAAIDGVRGDESTVTVSVDPLSGRAQ
jgi:O-antigen/teichoic acid export membrane protein